MSPQSHLYRMGIIYVRTAYDKWQNFKINADFFRRLNDNELGAT